MLAPARHRLRAVSVVLGAVIVAACATGSTTGPIDATPGASLAPNSSPSATGIVSPAVMPATPVGAELTWILELVNHGEGGVSSVSQAELEAAFSPAFLAAVPAPSLVVTLRQVAAAGPYTVAAFEPSADGFSATARFASPRVTIEVKIGIGPTAPPQISALLFRAVGAGGGSSWNAVETTLTSSASEHSLYAAEVVGNGCQPIATLNPDKAYPIGSTFKLYVLGELARQIEAGKASWHQQLAIRDDWRSLLGGSMGNEPAGTKHSLLDYATQMISVSDNTAADHLIHLLGRQAVEDNLRPMGMADPSRNEPFLLTRDAFVLKATKDADLRARFLAAGGAGRRALLDGPVASTAVAPADFADWLAPRYIDSIEWFASSSDLCGAMAGLHQMSAKPGLGNILDVLSVNPGIGVDQSRWTYVGFKGGSEPGVLQLTWLLRRSDDRWFVLSMTLDDPAVASDNPFVSLGLAATALDLLAATR